MTSARERPELGGLEMMMSGMVSWTMLAITEPVLMRGLLGWFVASVTVLGVIVYGVDRVRSSGVLRGLGEVVPVAVVTAVILAGCVWFFTGEAPILPGSIIVLRSLLH